MRLSIERILGALLGVALVILLVTTLLSFSARTFWLGDILANLRIQQVIGLGGVFVGLLVLRKWRWLLVILTLLVVHGWFFWPALQLPRSSQSEEPDFRLMLANVLTGNLEHEKIVEAGLASEADAIVILELSFDLSDRLKSEWSALYPHQHALPQDGGNFGIGVYSKQPIHDLEVFETSEDVPTLAMNAAGLRLFATHPLPPVEAEGFAMRNRQLDDLVQRVRSSGVGKSLPTIVAGDLNLTPWSPVFQDFSESTGLHRAAQLGEVITPTWYANDRFPWLTLGLALDHALCSAELRCVTYEVGPDIGSDHRPIVWDFVLEKP